MTNYPNHSTPTTQMLSMTLAETKLYPLRLKRNLNQNLDRDYMLRNFERLNSITYTRMSKVLETHKFLSCLVDISIFDAQVSMLTVATDTLRLAFVALCITRTRSTIIICNNTAEFHKFNYAIMLRLRSQFRSSTIRLNIYVY